MFSNLCLKIYPQIVCMERCLNLFDISPPCIFKCAFKLPFLVEAYSHWLHLVAVTFENLNSIGIRIWSFLKIRIVFVFVFGNF